MLVKDETIWLTQKAVSALFDVQVPAINKHIKNIYNEGELEENTTIPKMETVGRIKKKTGMNIEQEIKEIQLRNRRVELDKV